jgi:cytochrome b involved in lipid metabolism
MFSKFLLNKYSQRIFGSVRGRNFRNVNLSKFYLSVPVLCSAGWFSKTSPDSNTNKSKSGNKTGDGAYDYASKFSQDYASWKPIYADKCDIERIIPLSEVKQHCSPSERCWYTYKGEVFDMTPFIEGHPGLKSRLLMAAGNDLEPYWEIYQDHLRGHVLPFVKKFKIGNLSAEDAKKAKNFRFFNAYDNDPVRHPDLLVNTYHPFNGEAVLERLTEKYYTPNELHYVRAHLPIPDIDADDYELEVHAGNGIKVSKTYTLKELKSKFKWYDVVSTLQCPNHSWTSVHLSLM